MILREMLVDDLDQVMEIEQDLFHVPWTKEGFFTFLTRDDAMFLVVEEKERYNQFDLDDAVDQNGNPVTLERIHFVKVQSAILKNVESIGEVSTEVVGFKAF